MAGTESFAAQGVDVRYDGVVVGARRIGVGVEYVLFKGVEVKYEAVGGALVGVDIKVDAGDGDVSVEVGEADDKSDAGDEDDGDGEGEGLVGVSGGPAPVLALSPVLELALEVVLALAFAFSLEGQSTEGDEGRTEPPRSLVKKDDSFLFKDCGCD